MGMFDVFKKKERKNTVQEIQKDESPKEELKEKPKKVAKEEPKKITKENFKEWYDSLSPNERRKADKIMEKNYLKFGNPLVCSVCGKPGGKIGRKGYTLKRMVDGKYEHLGECP